MWRRRPNRHVPPFGHVVDSAMLSRGANTLIRTFVPQGRRLGDGPCRGSCTLPHERPRRTGRIPGARDVRVRRASVPCIANHRQRRGRSDGRPGVAGRSGLALAGVVVAAVLAGCSGQSLDTNGVKVLVGERASGGMDAQGGGRLEVVDGCLGARATVIVWPFGTRIVDDDPITVGGGYVLEHSSTARESGPFEVAGVTFPAGCAEHDVFLAS